MKLNLETGRFSGQEPQAIRTAADLASIFADSDAALAAEPAVVYEIHGGPAEIEGPPQLLYSTTVLHPGKIGNEFFMTRGHFHVNPDRGEFMLTLQGEGALILMDRFRNTWLEPMSQGSVHNVDGRFAHRVANTGESPLVFLVTWMSDCGHDYETIKANGFGKILVSGPEGPSLMNLPRV